MGNVPIDPEGEDFPISPAQVDALTELVEKVEGPLIVTISTPSDCVCISNDALVAADPTKKSEIFHLLVSVIAEQMANWEEERQAK